MKHQYKKYLKRLISMLWLLSGLHLIYLACKNIGGGIFCPIITYHSISENGEYCNVKQSEFMRQLDLMNKHCTIIPMDQLYQNINGIKSTPMPSRPLVVVFDDGFKDNRILAKVGIPATIFIATDYIGNENYYDQKDGYPKREMLSREEIIMLSGSGIDFGAHTRSHCRVSLQGDLDLRSELLGSKAVLEDILGMGIKGMAYPKGQKADYNNTAMRIAKETGYEYACSTVWSTFNSKDDLYALKRIRIDYEDDLLDFKWKIRGYYDWIEILHLLKPRLQQVRNMIVERIGAFNR